MEENEQHGGGVAHATCGPDDKVDPQAVPVCEFSGGVQMPQTGGKMLLAFKTQDGSTIAVRLEEGEFDRMVTDIEAVTSL